MIGFPKTLNTRSDYEYVAKNFDKELWQPHFQNLIDSAYDWFFVRYLEDEETIEITGSLKVEEPQEQSNETRRALYEYKLNENCKMLKIGFTEEEVKNFLE